MRLAADHTGALRHWNLHDLNLVFIAENGASRPGWPDRTYT